MLCSICGRVIEDDEKYDDGHFGICHESCLETMVDDSDEPKEDDYYTEDYRRFYQYGKLVVTVPMTNEFEPEDWRPYVKDHMEQEQFWPNVWFQGERGTLDLLSFETGGFASEANRED